MLMTQDLPIARVIGPNDDGYRDLLNRFDQTGVDGTRDDLFKINVHSTGQWSLVELQTMLAVMLESRRHRNCNHD